MEMVRNRPPINVTLDRKVVGALDRWISQQEFNFGRGQVIDAALRAYLREKGVDVNDD